MKIYNDWYGYKVLVWSNKPYCFFRLFLDIDENHLGMPPLGFEKMRVQKYAHADIYPRSYEEREFLISRFKGIGPVSYGSDVKYTSRKRTYFYDIEGPPPTSYIIGLRIEPNRFKKFCKLLRKLGKEGYKTAYRSSVPNHFIVIK